jgi:ATP-dependent DNA helicase RecG
MNLMFEQSIRQAKLRPDLSGTDAYQVVLTLNGEVRDPNFLQFIEKVGRETQALFGTHDLLVLDLVHREEIVPAIWHEHLRRLVDLGVVETLGRGRGTRYLLSRRFYVMAGRSGAYTRRRGLDRDQNKELLLRHVRHAGQNGSPMSELQQVLPALSREQLKRIMGELRREGHVRLDGTRRWAKWVAITE